MKTLFCIYTYNWCRQSTNDFSFGGKSKSRGNEVQRAGGKTENVFICIQHTNIHKNVLNYALHISHSTRKSKIYGMKPLFNFLQMIMWKMQKRRQGVRSGKSLFPALILDSFRPCSCAYKWVVYMKYMKDINAKFYVFKVLLHWPKLYEMKMWKI